MMKSKHGYIICHVVKYVVKYVFYALIKREENKYSINNNTHLLFHKTNGLYCFSTVHVCMYVCMYDWMYEVESIIYVQNCI